MTYIIAEPCVDLKDGACVDVCPVDCIYTEDTDNMYFINPDECIDCAACEPVCPVTAIFAEEDTPPNGNPTSTKTTSTSTSLASRNDNPVSLNHPARPTSEMTWIRQGVI